MRSAISATALFLALVTVLDSLMEYNTLGILRALQGSFQDEKELVVPSSVDVEAWVAAVLNETASATNATNHSHAPNRPVNLQLQDVARQGLHLLRESPAFQSVGIQSPLEISNKAILRAWDPCTLYQEEAKSFNIVIMGGSMSSRNSNNCHITADRRPEEGRYSNILQHNLRTLGVNATVHNMAQGGATSGWSALYLEKLLDENTPIDLLVWEHSINDFAPFNKNSADHMLAFFLARVQRLFVQRQQPVPPILATYIWRKNIGGVPLERLRDYGLGFGGPLFNRSLEVVDRFRARVPIEVLHLAGAIHKDSFIPHRKDFLDDSQHPSCIGSHFIADALQYALLANTNDAACATERIHKKPLPVAAADKAPAELSRPKNTTASDTESTDLLEALLDPATTIHTLCHWEPSTTNNNLPSLIEAESQEEAKNHLEVFGKVGVGRHDRKTSYQVPLCSNTTSILRFTLAAKDWHWLNVGYTGTNIWFRLNNQEPTPLSGNGFSMSRMGAPINSVGKKKNHHWLDLRTRQEELLLAESPVSISFCDNVTEAEHVSANNDIQWSWIHMLAAVKAEGQEY